MRTPTLSLRLQSLVNWPSNVRHPFLNSYIKHVFQDYIIADPGIRASTTGIWINLTIFKQPFHPLIERETALEDHPKYKSPTIDFSNVNLINAMGPMEERIFKLLNDHEKKGKDGQITVKEGHFYFKRLATGSPGHPLASKNGHVDPWSALQIYRNVPIHIRINKIDNPLLDAQVLAHYVARCLKKNDRALPMIYKQLLSSLNK